MNEKGKSTLEKYHKYLNLKNYADTTIKTYCHYVKEFMDSFDKSALHITAKDIKEYAENYNYSSIAVQNQIYSSIKLFAKYMLNIKHIEKIILDRPRKEKKLPRIIDKEFLHNKIHAIKNLKQKAIIMVAYCCALRVSEVLNLRIEDINSKRMLVFVRNSKGNKDRYTTISKDTIETLREYFREYKPKEYLFNGQSSNKYSRSSCSKIVKKHLGLDYHFHLLRHSGLTHMLENGTDIRVLQVIAGHENLKTTSLYCHVSTQLLQSVTPPI